MNARTGYFNHGRDTKSNRTPKRDKTETSKSIGNLCKNQPPRKTTIHYGTQSDSEIKTFHFPLVLQIFDTAGSIQNTIAKNALVLHILFARPGAHVHQITLSVTSGEHTNGRKFTPQMHASKLALPFEKQGGPIGDGRPARDV